MIFDKIDGPIYRRFSNPTYANDLCDGYVYLSTLEQCRRYENAERGDAGEAIHTYSSGEAHSSSEDFQVIASRLGLKISSDSTGTIRGNTRLLKIRDGWILCATLTDDVALADTFGQFCVRIDKPYRFIKRVSAALIDEAAKQAYHYQGGEGGLLGLVQYRPREYAASEPEPGPVGFVKPAYPYAAQREVRMLWPAHSELGDMLEPIRVPCTSIRTLCRRIS